MSFDRSLITALAREMQGRTDIDDATLEETAQRIDGLVNRLRQIDENSLRQVVPAISFDPAAPAYQTAPIAGEQLYVGMAHASGGTGYGGSSGTTGVVAPPSRPSPPTIQGPDFVRWSAYELVQAMAKRQISPVEVTRAFLDRTAAIDPSLNAFVTVLADQAMADARQAESTREPRGLLAGLPIALKDLFETAGIRTTGGSRLLAQNVPTSDATAVRRLKAAGAIIFGKTATHEFAFGATSDSPYHGPVHNPWDRSRIPGGSSGGSASAVAASLCPIALGTDTGGSIRMPASCCGLVGLKPTYGRVSKAGVLPLSWSLDHVGPIAQTVQDAALILAVLAGPDPADPTALPVPVDDYLAAVKVTDLRGVRLGIPAEWLTEGIDDEVLALFHLAVDRLKHLGAELIQVSLPPVGLMTFVNRVITAAEAGAYHADSLRERAQDFAPDVRLRLELGACISARDYLTAQRMRGELARAVNAVMIGVDALLVPTLAIPPAQIGQAMWEYNGGRREPVVEAMVRFPAPFSVTGQPAISMPMGLTSGRLPAGMQIVGRPFGEASLLRVAAAFEAVSGPVAHPI